MLRAEAGQEQGRRRHRFAGLDCGAQGRDRCIRVKVEQTVTYVSILNPKSILSLGQQNVSQILCLNVHRCNVTIWMMQTVPRCPEHVLPNNHSCLCRNLPFSHSYLISVWLSGPPSGTVQWWSPNEAVPVYSPSRKGTWFTGSLALAFILKRKSLAIQSKVCVWLVYAAGVCVTGVCVCSWCVPLVCSWAKSFI